MPSMKVCYLILSIEMSSQQVSQNTFTHLPLKENMQNKNEALILKV